MKLFSAKVIFFDKSNEASEKVEIISDMNNKIAIITHVLKKLKKDSNSLRISDVEKIERATNSLCDLIKQLKDENNECT